jgi:hypothetical protein
MQRLLKTTPVKLSMIHRELDPTSHHDFSYIFKGLIGPFVDPIKP